jgi:beta-glucuronidase
LAAAAASRRLTSADECSGGGRCLRPVAGEHLTPHRRWWLALLAGLLTLISAPALPAEAAAQAPYTPTPPTHGALYQDGQNDRWLLGGTWLARPDPSDASVSAGWWRNVGSTAGWSPVSVPNSFNAGDLSTASMNGSVEWYRRDFTVPPDAFASYVPARFRSWVIRFESVNYDATVWLNGRRIGAHAGAYLPFELSLKGVHSGVNRLVVRVDDRRNGKSLPPGPSGGWWNFGGINREVYLRAVQRVDMTPVVIRPVLPCPTCAATINEQVSVTNPTGARQTVVLQGTYGGAKLNFHAHTIAPGATWTAQAQLRIAHPHLWAPGSPYLYKATLTISDANGRKLEGYLDYSGIRSIAVGGDGSLLLNGRRLNLRGFNIHEMNITTGDALSPTQLAALVGWVRELGGGIIRAHYPLDPQIEELADRDGILLWSEIPVYQVKTEYLSNPAWLAFAHQELRTNILTNENHPSVLVWSVGNELITPPPDPETRYIAGAAALAHQLDPTRPVGMAISDWPGVDCQIAYAPLDVIGFNDYFGWFDAGGGSTDDADGLGPFLDSLHACYPSKSLMITEFGFEGNRSGPVEERGTYQFQAAAAAFHLGVFASKPYISAAMWFALQDFPAHPGWTGGDPFGDPPFVQKGEIDSYGTPRQPLFGTIQSIYAGTTQIAPGVTAQKRAKGTGQGARVKRPAPPGT